MPSIWVCYPGAPYTHRAAVQAARRVLEPLQWSVIDADSKKISDSVDVPTHMDAYLADYDLLPFDILLGSSQRCSSYVIRKALIRKHHLAKILHAYSVKHSLPCNKSPCPRTWTLDIQFADELDELLADDLYDLRNLLEEGDGHAWFILKPGMADQANGIRLFSSVHQLRDIFEEFEDKDDENSNNEESANAVVASQLRHFVIQEYVSTPLLVAPGNPDAPPRKFHLRVYVICVGGLQVYMHDDMLALFASTAYQPPNDATLRDLRAHLSNTCFGARHTAPTDMKDGNVFRWQDLIGRPAYVPGRSEPVKLTSAHIDAVRKCAAVCIGRTMEAVAREASIHWQLWPNAFEVFGVDLLVGCEGNTDGNLDPASLRTWLLEVNAVCIHKGGGRGTTPESACYLCQQPDFAQSGDELSGVVDHVFERVVQVGVLGESPWPEGESHNQCTCCFAAPLIKS